MRMLAKSLTMASATALLALGLAGPGAAAGDGPPSGSPPGDSGVVLPGDPAWNPPGNPDLSPPGNPGLTPPEASGGNQGQGSSGDANGGSQENNGANGHAKGRPSQGRAMLAPPDGATDTDAFARLDVKHFPAIASRAERSWFRLRIRLLDASTGYSIWADDPSTPETDLVQVDTFTTNADGSFNWVKDTKRGDALPFGATLADLAGKSIEVRTADGATTLLAGTIPSMSP